MSAPPLYSFCHRYEDVPLFTGLIGDLFPGLDCPRVGYPSFNGAVEESLREGKYILNGHQVDKVVQLYETMLTRHTTMVVGNTGGGKSVVINTLASAQTKLGINTKLYTVNAKAINIWELYGVLDPETRDWTDGLLSKTFREICRPTEKNEKRYVVFDGDVDALWVENMNSVMDDNKVLTLPNGERIRLANHCALLVEVGDLQYASPATISRCGMVYVDPKDLKYTPFWQKWVNSREKEAERELFTALFDKYVHPTIARILDGLDEGKAVARLNMIIPLTNLNMVRQLASMIDAILPGDADTPCDGVMLENIFVCSLVWAVGASLLQDDRIIMDKMIRRLAGGSVALPTTEPTLFDVYYDVGKKRWVSWREIVPAYTHDPSLAFHNILVPTTDSVRTSWLLGLMTQIDRPVLLVGESGTSKTATVTAFCNSLPQTQYQARCARAEAR